MGIDPKSFIALLKRAAKCRYSTVVMNNHMLMQCYDIAIDSDVGIHYILHIPDTMDYNDELYDMCLVIDHKKVIETYNEGHDIALQKRKEKGLKPKAANEVMTYTVHENKHYVELVFEFYVMDEIVATTRCKLKIPMSYDPTVNNIVNTYENMIMRVKVGGNGIVFDALAENILEKTLKAETMLYHILKLGKNTVRLPLYKTLFVSSKCDEMYMSVQETNIDMVYLWTISCIYKGLHEQFICYVQSFN